MRLRAESVLGGGRGCWGVLGVVCIFYFIFLGGEGGEVGVIFGEFLGGFWGEGGNLL